MISVPFGLMKQVGAIDIRTICPIVDQHGGVVIYDRGRPTHYLLEGEWYTALSEDWTTGLQLDHVEVEENLVNGNAGGLGPPSLRMKN